MRLAFLSDEELKTAYTLYPDEVYKIWADVLIQAKRDLFLHQFKLNASEWFISNRYEVGSFLWICDSLDINSQAVRKKYKKKIYYHFSTVV